MAYTIGARHVLTGSGTVAITSPIGLKLAIANIPTYLGRTGGTPLEYFTLGNLVPGNADGWLPRWPLHHAAELVYPLPSGLDILGYDLVAGATATVDELVAVAVPGPLAMPWDRTAQSMNLGSYIQQASPNTGSLWSYTVPPGFNFWVATGFALMSRVREPTVKSWSVLSISRNGATILAVEDYGPNTDLVLSSSIAPSALVIFSGETLAATYIMLDTDGVRNLEAAVSGFIYMVDPGK